MVDFGKWADVKFRNKTGLRFYPRYANGASGYVISDTIARLITHKFNYLECYSNEDASLGWWIFNLLGPRKTHYLDVRGKQFSWGGYPQCNHTDHLVIGHNMSPGGLGKCYEVMKESLEELGEGEFELKEPNDLSARYVAN